MNDSPSEEILRADLVDARLKLHHEKTCHQQAEACICRTERKLAEAQARIAQLVKLGTLIAGRYWSQNQDSAEAVKVVDQWNKLIEDSSNGSHR